MKKLVFLTVFCAVLSCGTLRAQNTGDITGTWQGAFKTSSGQQFRVVFKFSMEDNNLKAMIYNVDRPSPPILANTFTRNGSDIKIRITAINGGFEGKIDPSGKSITGTLTLGAPASLTLERATPDTAWTIPDSPPSLRLMAPNANPSFEVSTIKPSRPDERSSILVNPSGLFIATNTSVSYLIKFAYDVHPRQILGEAAWVESEKFDVTGKPDTEGIPNVTQLKVMLQKLLADRFQLRFHREKKELNVYAITVAKTGAKITKDDSNPTGLPAFLGTGPQGLNFLNSTMAEFASMLQANVLDRPVVDQTGFGSARYNFILKFTPDGLQTGTVGGPPNAGPPTDPSADIPPDIYTAFQQQLGLKLDSVKMPVEVIIIDSVSKPSDN